MSDDININEEIAAAHLAASGWQCRHFANGDVFSCHAVYYYNHTTQKREIYTLAQDALTKAKLQMANFPEGTTMDDLAGAVTSAIDSRDYALLGWSLAAYIVSSRTYNIWEGRGFMPDSQRLHFLLVHYSKNNLLRPVIIQQTQKTFAMADELTECIDATLEMDRRNHPDWGV